MKSILKMSLALLLALSLCVSLGSVALAGPLYDSEYLDWDDYDYDDSGDGDYSDWHLYLWGGNMDYSVGDVVDTDLDCSPGMDASLIDWSYDRNYLTHTGNGIFVVTNADSSNKNMTITATYNIGSVYLTDSCSLMIRGTSSGGSDWYDDDYDWDYDYQDDYSDWHLYLWGYGNCSVGDVFDAELDINPQMDTNLISWDYNSHYLTHLGYGIFTVNDSDYNDLNLTITATYDVGSLHLTDSCAVTIPGYGSRGGGFTPTPSSSFYVTLDSSSMIMNVGDTNYLLATCRGGTSPYSYSWYSENPNVVRIISGSTGSRADLRAESSGSTRIVCETRDRYGNYDYAYCTVDVYGTRARVTSISLSYYSVTMSALSSRSLSVSVTDPKANYSVSWSSSNSQIVSVSGSGNNATLSSYGTSGTANVMVTVRDNSTGLSKSETCRVTVEANKNSTFNPSTTINLGSTTAGTKIYDSLRSQFQSVYGETLSDSATITFGAASSNIATRKLSNGTAVSAGPGYTMSQYKGMYTEPYASGVFSTPYTVTWNNKSLSGTISVEITPAYVTASIPLSANAPYLFAQATPAGNAVTIISSAIRNALGASTNINWSYLRFQMMTGTVGTLYASAAMDPLSPAANINAQTLGNLYFVPTAAGTFSTTFTAYNSNGGSLATGNLMIIVPEAAGTTPVAVLSSQNLTLNGVPVAAEMYNINGENYFKLRDVAMMLNGTGSQFEVGYDDATRTISVMTGRPYTPNWTELVLGVDKSATCVISDMVVSVNGVPVRPTAFNLGGNNFFRLRDLGDMIGFTVDYDAVTRTILVYSR